MNKLTIAAAIVLEVLFAVSMFIAGKASTLDSNTLKYYTLQKEIIETQYDYINNTENLLDSIEWDCHWLDITGESDTYSKYIDTKDKLEKLLKEI